MGQWGVWIIFAIIFAIAEAVLPSFFFLWFAIGAGVAAVSSLFISSASLNLIIFLTVSFILWISTKRIVQRLYKSSSDSKVYQEQIAGKKGKIDKIYDNGRIIVRIKGDEWRAFPEEDQPMNELHVGDDVIITRKSANFVYIKKLESSEDNKREEV
ncbi:hypothetical protein PW5551_03210 [Petrotoga sp. 9PW.55.5.1]|jgi:membrane protein implicated in regulation of membrane protease activity|uniref:NfeD family protein n=1 Tax=Petrotoga sp. 9PW.55.5.1 TaxID=1308979 RepID=UPI000DC2B05F|nr:NfeD family protein [Petrotoga sp. 9PW.55.5.1]RAO99510.1 hypothetical protein PW5551_03210 [Petrotoga sp. 9PW.55.5.1]